MGLQRHNRNGSRSRWALNVRTGHLLVVFCQHAALWSCIYIIASEIYLFIIGAITTAILPSSVVLLASAVITILYIAFFNAAASLWTATQTSKIATRKSLFQSLTSILLRLAVTLWLVSCGLEIMYTMARHPSCQLSSRSDSGSETAIIDVGAACVVQRTGIGAGIVALLTSIALFVLMHKVSEPFRCHLFGISQTQGLRPLILPFRETAKEAMFSDLSFECFSSDSLDTHRETPSSRGSSLTSLLPCKPEYAAGLGIYAPKQLSKSSFLSARPSLASIRSHITASLPPPPSRGAPLLPTYFPNRYLPSSTVDQKVSAMQAVALTSHNSQNDRTVRMVPPSPAVFAGTMTTFNKKLDRQSMSSVYSRSISGDKPASLIAVDTRTVSAMSYSSARTSSTWSASNSRAPSTTSTGTTIRSPLDTMQTIADLEDTVAGSSPSRSNSSMSTTSDMSSDIDDVETLHARMPSGKALFAFGPLGSSPVVKEAHTSFQARPWELARDLSRQRLEFTPLTVMKTRDSSKVSLV